MKADPCNCKTLCVHGERCMGGHANYPDSHWYPCDKCTPTRKITLAEALKVHAERKKKRSKRR